jgi:hypothetical protein
VEYVLQRILAKKYYAKIDAASLTFRIFQRSVEKLDFILTQYHTTLSQVFTFPL